MEYKLPEVPEWPDPRELKKEWEERRIERDIQATVRLRNLIVWFTVNGRSEIRVETR